MFGGYNNTVEIKCSLHRSAHFTCTQSNPDMIKHEFKSIRHLKIDLFITTKSITQTQQTKVLPLTVEKKIIKKQH